MKRREMKMLRSGLTVVRRLSREGLMTYARMLRMTPTKQEVSKPLRVARLPKSCVTASSKRFHTPRQLAVLKRFTTVCVNRKSTKSKRKKFF